jgi:succinyl-CoA:acetate CoA-transferase
MPESRIGNAAFAAKVMSADAAAELIRPGSRVGMSGFTGSGYPKALPEALAARIERAHRDGDPFSVSVWTGASTAPGLDGALAAVDGMDMRMPYQSDPLTRKKINSGAIDYVDIHLSHVAPMVREGFFGRLDVAVVEVAAIDADGTLLPSSSLGNNKTWIDFADSVIIEVNQWQPEGLRGIHDVYYGTALPPNRVPIPLTHPADRIGVAHLRCPPEKVIAVVHTDDADRNTPFKEADDTCQRIGEHVADFFEHEVRRGRLPADLLPLQSGVGNVANAVLHALDAGALNGLTAFTEVIQDGMLQLLRSGTMSVASATAFSLSPDALAEFQADMDFFRTRIVLRPQEISNHPELIRRLGCLAMNGLIEADIYGNVNSTHVMGSRIQNGIGGSGDFARNAYISMFLTPSTAKGGAISAIVPMVSHVDHTEHDVHVLVTENGLADLRGLSPRRRARLIIDKCAHPDYRDALRDYFDRAVVGAYGQQTPHLLEEALSWHVRFMGSGSMRPDPALATHSQVPSPSVRLPDAAPT